MSLLPRRFPSFFRRAAAPEVEALLGPYRGDFVRLETSSRCQLRCRLCPTPGGAVRAGSVGWGVLTLSDFARFLVRNPAVRRVELSNYGEIFLNPELAGILAHAHAAGVGLQAENGANLNHATEEQLEAVVRLGLRSLVVSIDGVSQETYAAYRVGGELTRVLDHVRRINEWKARLGSSFPRLVWQFVVFGHNEHELPAARRLAGELGMGFFAKVNWDERYSPVRDPAFVRAETGLEAFTHAAFAGAARERYFLGCRDLWVGPQVNWDGRLLGCCVNFWGDFGNVFAEGLEACTGGEPYQHVKRVLLGLEQPRRDLPCLNCGLYRDDVRLRPLAPQDIRIPDALTRLKEEALRG